MITPSCTMIVTEPNFKLRSDARTSSQVYSAIWSFPGSTCTGIWGDVSIARFPPPIMIGAPLFVSYVTKSYTRVRGQTRGHSSDRYTRGRHGSNAIGGKIQAANRPALADPQVFWPRPWRSSLPD